MSEQDVLVVGEELSNLTEMHIDEIDEDLDVLNAQNTDLSRTDLYALKAQYLEAKIKSLQKDLENNGDDLAKVIAYANERLAGLRALSTRELQLAS